MTRNINLSIADRISLMSILPSEGDILTLRLIRDFQTDLALSENEIKTYEVKSTGQAMQWNQKGIDYRKNFRLSDATIGLVREKLEDLNKTKKLHIQLISLYERFVEGQKSTEDASKDKADEIQAEQMKKAQS